MINRVLFGAMAALAVGAIIAGLLAVGGPQQARLEKQDRALLSDMRFLARQLRCEEPDEVLPMGIALDERVRFCGADRVLWSAAQRQRTEVPITYERLGDTAFTLCATFNDPNLATLMEWELRDIDISSGCIAGTIR